MKIEFQAGKRECETGKGSFKRASRSYGCLDNIA
jgi:hypothetical protein